MCEPYLQVLTSEHTGKATVVSENVVLATRAETPSLSHTSSIQDKSCHWGSGLKNNWLRKCTWALDKARLSAALHWSSSIVLLGWACLPMYKARTT